MCGIAGAVFRGSTRPIDWDRVQTRMAHRGPDDRGFWNDDSAALCHSRLSILDLSPLGHQPMSSHNGRYVIVFNGEIYNFIELRNELQGLGVRFEGSGDTEVLLAAYVEWGKACVSRLRGMFAFAIWDRVDKALFMARDRCGEKPFYFWQSDGEFLFASELKTLIAMMPVRPEIDPAAFDLYLHYQYVPEPATPLAGVHKLEAGHTLEVSTRRWTAEPARYWDLGDAEPIDADPIPLIREELKRSVELTLRADVPVGVALSGGIDSGAVATLASIGNRDSMHAFTVGYTGEPPVDERKYARELAKSLGVTLHEAEIDPNEFIDRFEGLVEYSDDPIADIAGYGHYMVTRLARDRGIKVVLSGTGGDELFWGYHWMARAAALTEKKAQYLRNPRLAAKDGIGLYSKLAPVTDHGLYRRAARSRRLPQSIRRGLTGALELGQISLDQPRQAVYVNLNQDFSSARRAAGLIYSPRALAMLPERNAYSPFQLNAMDSEEAPIDIYKLLYRTWLVSNCLSLSDRLSMASSVEMRMPLLDCRLIELVVGLTKTHGQHRLPHKSWMREALRGILPDEVLDRPKRGFEPPSMVWMRMVIGRFGPLLRDGILVSSGLIRGEIASNFDENVSKDMLSVAFKLTLFELWYRKVVLQAT